MQVDIGFEPQYNGLTVIVLGNNHRCLIANNLFVPFFKNSKEIKKQHCFSQQPILLITRYQLKSKTNHKLE